MSDDHAPGCVVFHYNAVDEVTEALRALRRSVLGHPVAAQALFASLVQEGRRFSRTDSGAEWLARLEGSELVERVRVIWDGLPLRTFDDDDQVVLPTAIVEAIVRAATDPSVADRVQEVLEDGIKGVPQ
ncbi:MAG: hypothetical protein AAGA48_11435 [Myxococcota bacterium]